jgi:hypothetical protein
MRNKHETFNQRCRRFFGPLMRPDGSPIPPLDVETFGQRFKREFNADTESLVSVSILILGFLFFYALTGLLK